MRRLIFKLLQTLQFENDDPKYKPFFYIITLHENKGSAVGKTKIMFFIFSHELPRLVIYIRRNPKKITGIFAPNCINERTELIKFKPTNSQ